MYFGLLVILVGRRTRFARQSLIQPPSGLRETAALAASLQRMARIDGDTIQVAEGITGYSSDQCTARIRVFGGVIV
jgi:hypothetical protein